MFCPDVLSFICLHRASKCNWTFAELFFFLKEILNFISNFWVILRLSMSVRFPAVPQVCLFIPLSSVSLFELFCSGPPADFRKRGKPRKPRVKKTQWVLCICLVMSVIWEVIQIGGRTCIFFFSCPSQSIAGGRAGKKPYVSWWSIL